MRFETTLLAVGNNTGIDVPPAVLDALGGGKRPLVNVVVNDGFTYRSAVASMAGRHLIASAPTSAPRPDCRAARRSRST